MATSLEAAVFTNFKKKTDALYKRRIQSLFLNLKDKKNGLRKRVVKGEITTERLSTMETHEMASEEQRKEDERTREENLRKSMVAKAPKSYSDQLTCGKCRQKRVSYTQAQTRSADEPMTTFCTCENCGNMWKVRHCPLLLARFSTYSLYSFHDPLDQYSSRLCCLALQYCLDIVIPFGPMVLCSISGACTVPYLVPASG